jgi:hypothetical protein
MANLDPVFTEAVRTQTCLQFARMTPTNRLPTLLRRIASDLDHLPPHLILGITIDVAYDTDEANATVFLAFDDELD